MSYSFLCQVLVHALWASTVEYKYYNDCILMRVWSPFVSRSINYLTTICAAVHIASILLMWSQCPRDLRFIACLAFILKCVSSVGKTRLTFAFLVWWFLPFSGVLACSHLTELLIDSHLYLPFCHMFLFFSLYFCVCCSLFALCRLNLPEMAEHRSPRGWSPA